MQIIYKIRNTKSCVIQHKKLLTLRYKVTIRLDFKKLSIPIYSIGSQKKSRMFSVLFVRNYKLQVRQVFLIIMDDYTRNP